MDKAVLISIRSGWCWKIAEGKKTVELRKNRPNMDTPFRCYIYCTRATPLLAWQERWAPDKKAFRKEVWPVHGCGRERAEKLFELFNGRVIGTFVCDKIDQLTHVGTMESNEPAKLYIETPDFQYEPADELLREACLNESIAEGYLKGGDGYGWHISDLKIYNQPKDIMCFHRAVEENELWCKKCAIGGKKDIHCAFCYGLDGLRLRRPPQSWCYVAEQKEAGE